MTREEALEKMKETIVDQLDIDASNITENADFVEDLGADSLDMLQLMTALEDEMGITIPDEEFENLKTVGDVLDIIAK